MHIYLQVRFFISFQFPLLSDIKFLKVTTISRSVTGPSPPAPTMPSPLPNSYTPSRGGLFTLFLDDFLNTCCCRVFKKLQR